MGSPPVLEQPGEAASIFEGDSSRISSGSGGAPGSPGLGRLEEVEGRLAHATELNSGPLWKEMRLREAPKSEVEALFSPVVWNNMVEVLEKERSDVEVVVGVESDELEADALRDSSFSFLAFCSSSVSLVMMNVCERISLMESSSASSPWGLSVRKSSRSPFLFLRVVLQLISSASSRVRIRRDLR